MMEQFTRRVLVDRTTAIAYEPSPYDHWNKGALPLTRNCYAFACNVLEPDTSELTSGLYEIVMPEPGFTGRGLMSHVRSDELRRALTADGFIALPHTDQKTINVPEGHYLVAAYASPEGIDGDYHFYRRHETDGTWFHKLGWEGPVTHFDAAGRVIRDPEKASRRYPQRHYWDFAGYFLAPDTGIKLDITVERRARLLWGQMLKRLKVADL